MQKESLNVDEFSEKKQPLPLYRVHSLVIGSGAAGLNAAVQLHAQGIEDVLIVTVRPFSSMLRG